MEVESLSEEWEGREEDIQTKSYDVYINEYARPQGVDSPSAGGAPVCTEVEADAAEVTQSRDLRGKCRSNRERVEIK